MVCLTSSDVPIPKFYPMPILTLEPDANTILILEVITRQMVTVYALIKGRINFITKIHF